MDISVIMPCLNEERSLGDCIDQVKEVIKKQNYHAEIIVVDNGSKDKSKQIAIEKEVRLIEEPKKGYGNAYISGINHANGKIIIMGDCDGTYDFNEIPNFIENLKINDFVIGNRFYDIQNGAMPFLHRYIGNPILRLMLRVYGLKINEVCTGFIGIKKPVLENLNLKEPGMEFSSEFLVKIAKNRLKIKELPITYYKRKGKSKLRTFHDGLRHFWFLFRELFKN